MDLNRSHIPIGDASMWTNLPQVFRTKFAQRKYYFFFFLNPLSIEVRQHCADASEAVVQVVFCGILDSRNITVPCLVGFGRLAPIQPVSVTSISFCPHL
jgi:hypothetical protein